MKEPFIVPTNTITSPRRGFTFCVSGMAGLYSVEVNCGVLGHAKDSILPESFLVLGGNRCYRCLIGGCRIMKNLHHVDVLVHHISARIEPLSLTVEDGQPFRKTRRDHLAHE